MHLPCSGGEKQRVALARAFLKSPRMLLCDEATSALDSNTEKEVLGALFSLARGRTCVVVAHRLSTAAQCDQIVVLEQVRVVGAQVQRAAAVGMRQTAARLALGHRRSASSARLLTQAGWLPAPPWCRGGWWRRGPTRSCWLREESTLSCGLASRHMLMRSMTADQRS